VNVSSAEQGVMLTKSGLLGVRARSLQLIPVFGGQLVERARWVSV
jgi:hypothetical protein